MGWDGMGGGGEVDVVAGRGTLVRFCTILTVQMSLGLYTVLLTSTPFLKR
jgi:hypothetical protein